MSPTVNGVETQKYPVSGPLRWNRKLLGQGGCFVFGDIVSLLHPLTWHLKIAPVCGVQRLLSAILDGLGINSPRPIERDGVLPQSRHSGSHRAVTHRCEGTVCFGARL